MSIPTIPFERSSHVQCASGLVSFKQLQHLLLHSTNADDGARTWCSSCTTPHDALGWPAWSLNSDPHANGSGRTCQSDVLRTTSRRSLGEKPLESRLEKRSETLGLASSPLLAGHVVYSPSVGVGWRSYPWSATPGTPYTARRAWLYRGQVLSNPRTNVWLRMGACQLRE